MPIHSATFASNNVRALPVVAIGLVPLSALVALVLVLVLIIPGGAG